MRNILYDKSILRSYHPSIPVAVVGNLIAGGTGKTPVIAWLAGELSKRYRIAILSRGYGRRTRGFRLLDDHSTPTTVGDEPLELKLLLPDVTVAVDRNRTRGIKILASGACGPVDLVLMDDGFQHRKVKPGLSILLDDATRAMREERMLPAGLRREPLASVKRADLILQTLKKKTKTDLPAGTRAILVTGIANAGPLADGLAGDGVLLKHLCYRDHHRYSRRDARMIRQAFEDGRREADPAPVVLLTTGKDFVKLSRLPELKDLPMRWLPMAAPLTAEQCETLLNTITEYVAKTNGNR